MTTFNKPEEESLEAWYQNVATKCDDVDPEQERDWFDMSYGFFLGRGHTPSNAYDLALEAQRRGFL